MIGIKVRDMDVARYARQRRYACNASSTFDVNLGEFEVSDLHAVSFYQTSGRIWADLVS